MYSDVKEFFELLPAIIRKRDYESGAKTKGSIKHSSGLTDPSDFGPLKSLLSVMLREGQIVQKDIFQLYDDHFIETCDDWVVPYIGDLVGAYALEDIDGPQALRRHVAATLPLRQLKGTLTALEYAVSIASGWPVKAVEYWKHLSITQSQRRVRMEQSGTIDFRNTSQLDKLGGAFDNIPRFYDSGSVETQGGKWNLPNIGLHIYRLKSTRHGFAKSIGNLADNLNTNFGYIIRPRENTQEYYFSPYFCDQPLFMRPPDLNPEPGSTWSELDLPTRISRYQLHENMEALFGPGKAINIIVRDDAGNVTSIPNHEIMAGNLEGWTHNPDTEKTCLDPETGRFLLATKYKGHEIFVTCYFGRAFEIGGGQREQSEVVELSLTPDHIMRSPTKIPTAPFVPKTITISGNRREINFEDTAKYILKTTHQQSFNKSIPKSAYMASENSWPIIFLDSNVGATLKCHSSDDSELRLSGLRFVSRKHQNSHLQILGDDVHVIIDDCTFLPGHRLQEDGNPDSAGATSISFDDGQSAVINRSIIGPVKLGNDVEIIFNDCIIDAGDLKNMAIFADSDTRGHKISLNRCTVIGRISVESVGGGDHYTQLAKSSQLGFGVVAGHNSEAPNEDAFVEGIRDSIILAISEDETPPLFVKNIQGGCVRFSFIPPGSRVPKEFRCWTPDSAFPAKEWPQLESFRFIDPEYCQLKLKNLPQILQGGENGSEMGVGNSQNNRARLTNLEIAKNEFMRFGYSAGPIFEN